MAAPSPVPDIDAGAGHVIDTVVAHGNPGRHRDLNSGRLLLDRSDPINQIVLGDAVGRICITLRALGVVNCRRWLGLLIFEKRGADSFRPSYERDPGGADVVDLV